MHSVQAPLRVPPLAVALDVPNDNLMAAGAALTAAIAGLGFMSSNQKDGETATANKSTKAGAEAEEVKIDVSIPYSAAAMLAYDTMRGQAAFDKKAFAKFEELYVEQAVMIAKSKKVARDHALEMKAMESKISSMEKDMAALASSS